MSDEKIRKALAEAGVAEKISCTDALAIADKCKVSRGTMGEYLTKNKIKIRGCQLGCFK
jgi:hypothetical protein